MLVGSGRHQNPPQTPSLPTRQPGGTSPPTRQPGGTSPPTRQPGGTGSPPLPVGASFQTLQPLDSSITRPIFSSEPSSSIGCLSACLGSVGVVLLGAAPFVVSPAVMFLSFIEIPHLFDKRNNHSDTVTSTANPDEQASQATDEFGSAESATVLPAAPIQVAGALDRSGESPSNKVAIEMLIFLVLAAAIKAVSWGPDSGFMKLMEQRQNSDQFPDCKKLKVNGVEHALALGLNLQEHLWVPRATLEQLGLSLDKFVAISLGEFGEQVSIGQVEACLGPAQQVNGVPTDFNNWCYVFWIAASLAMISEARSGDAWGVRTQAGVFLFKIIAATALFRVASEQPLGPYDEIDNPGQQDVAGLHAALFSFFLFTIVENSVALGMGKQGSLVLPPIVRKTIGPICSSLVGFSKGFMPRCSSLVGLVKGFMPRNQYRQGHSVEASIGFDGV